MARRPVRIRRILFAAALATLALPAPSRAGSWSLAPSLTLSESYDSNIFNAPDNEVDDFIFRASPRLDLIRKEPRSTFRLGGGFESELYADNHDLSEGVATIFADLSLGGPLRLTERLGATASARYVETNDPTRRNALVASPDLELPPSEILITERVESRDLAAALRFGYRVSEATEFGLGGSWSRLHYIDARPGLNDSETFGGNASLTRRFSPLLSGGVFLAAAFDSNEDGTDSDSYSSGLSASYRLSETTVTDLRAGVTYLREDAGGGGRTDDWQPTGSLRLTYGKESFRASLRASYELAGGTSFGVPVERIDGSLGLSGAFTPKWGWDLGGSAQSNRSTDGGATADYVSAFGSAGVRYRPVRWATVRLAGSADRQWSDTSAVSDVTRRAATFSVTLADTYPLD